MNADDLIDYFGPVEIREFIERTKDIPAGTHLTALAIRKFGKNGLDVLANLGEIKSALAMQ